MRTPTLGLLLLPAIAAAEPVRYGTALDVRVDDPGHELTVTALTGALRSIRRPGLDACWDKPGAMTMKVTFDGGKATEVARADAIATDGDDHAAACITRALRAITFASRANRVTTTYALRAELLPVPSPPRNSKADQQVIDSVIDRDRDTPLSKFTGIRGDGGMTRTGAGPGSSGSARTDPGAIEPPAAPRTAKIAFGAGPTGAFGDRSADSIQRVVVSRAGVLRACYQRALHRTPGIAGAVVVAFSIEPDGSVASLMNSASTALLPEDIVACVKTNVHRLRFNATKGRSEVSHPFVFSEGP